MGGQNKYKCRIAPVNLISPISGYIMNNNVQNIISAIGYEWF